MEANPWDWDWDCIELCVWSLWLCTITIWVILLVFGLAGALSVSILVSVEIILSHVLLCRPCKTGDTMIGYTLFKTNWNLFGDSEGCRGTFQFLSHFLIIIVVTD